MSHTIKNKTHSRNYKSWASVKRKFREKVNEQSYDIYCVKAMPFNTPAYLRDDEYERKLKQLQMAIHYRRERIKFLAQRCKELKRRVRVSSDYQP